MYFLSLRKVFIRNESGTHDMWVPANKAVFIVPKLHQAAMAAGCVQCNEHGVVEQPEDDMPMDDVPAPVQPQVESNLEVDPDPSPAYSQDDVVSAVEALIARNNKSDFSPSGRPKVNAVSAVVGEKISLQEIEAAWQEVDSRITEDD